MMLSALAKLAKRLVLKLHPYTSITRAKKDIFQAILDEMAKRCEQQAAAMQINGLDTIHFYAPIYLLFTMCDRQPDREQQILQILEQHIRQFNRLYRIGGIM